MANFKRKRTSRQVRCTICTANKWLGNNKRGGYSGGRGRTAKADRNRVSTHELE